MRSINWKTFSLAPTDCIRDDKLSPTHHVEYISHSLYNINFVSCSAVILPLIINIPPISTAITYKTNCDNKSISQSQFYINHKVGRKTRLALQNTSTYFYLCHKLKASGFDKRCTNLNLKWTKLIIHTFWLTRLTEMHLIMPLLRPQLIIRTESKWHIQSKVRCSI